MDGVVVMSAVDDTDVPDMEAHANPSSQVRARVLTTQDSPAADPW